MKRLLLITCLLVSIAAVGQTSGGSITASGSSCTATTCVSLATYASTGSASIGVSGTYSGTLQFEASPDNGGNWVAINAYPSNSTTAATSTTSTGAWQVNLAGFTNIRVRCSSYASGTAVVNLQASPAAAKNFGSGSSPSGAAGGDLSGTFPNPTVAKCNGGTCGTVTSATFTGDGVVLSSTPSGAVTTSGTVTATLATAAANTILGNGTGGVAAPTYLTTLPTAAEPGFTGDVTKAAGSVATTVGSINGATVPISKTVVGTNGSGQIVDATGSVPVTLYALHTDLTKINPGATTNTVIGFYTLPANTVAANGRVEVKFTVAGCTAASTPFASCAGINTGTCTVRIGLNTANNGTSSNIFQSQSPAASQSITGWGDFANRNATNAQIFYQNSITSGAASAAPIPVTAAIDTTSQQFITFMMQNSVATDGCGYRDISITYWPQG